MKETIGPLVVIIEEATGLDTMQAKTAGYYAVATNALPKLGKFPTLVVYGPAGTEKVTFLSVMEQGVGLHLTRVAERDGLMAQFQGKRVAVFVGKQQITAYRQAKEAIGFYLGMRVSGTDRDVTLRVKA